jgi:hypothetical protein
MAMRYAPAMVASARSEVRASVSKMSLCRQMLSVWMRNISRRKNRRSSDGSSLASASST